MIAPITLQLCILKLIAIRNDSKRTSSKHEEYS